MEKLMEHVADKLNTYFQTATALSASMVHFVTKYYLYNDYLNINSNLSTVIETLDNTLVFVALDQLKDSYEDIDTTSIDNITENLLSDNLELIYVDTKTLEQHVFICFDLNN